MDDRTAERAELVEQLIRLGDITDSRVAAAMNDVPRHWFIPVEADPYAYINAPLPIGFGQTISQPSVVAMMTEALVLEGRERVLEIGTGSGWQAAILAKLCAEVYTIERIAPLGEQAERTLTAHGFQNVHVRVSDGYEGWPDQAPYDRIIITAAPPELPAALYEQLAEGGLLVAPVGEYDQMLVREQKASGKMHHQDLLPVRFVPMLGGVASGR